MDCNRRLAVLNQVLFFLMKKFLVAILLAVVAFGASAKFRWGPTVGVNFADFYWKQHLLQTDMTTGFQAGLIGEIMIPGIGFGVDLALKYANMGAKVHFGDRPVWSLDGYGMQNIRYHNLQIPLNVRFKWTRMDGFEHYLAPIVFAGPVLNFNLATSKCDAVTHPTASFGLQCGIGGEVLERIQLTAGYRWGLTYDIQTVKLDEFSARTQNWFVDLTYLF